MSKHLTREQKELIRWKHEQGATNIDIATEFKISRFTVSYIINGDNWKRASCDKKPPYQCKTPDAKTVEEVDLSSLPGTILFKHDRYYSF